MVMQLQVILWFLAMVVLASHWVLKWMNPKCKNGKLPPGSMGFPVIGESIEFFSAHSLYGVPPFIRKRIARYGSLFRTNIFGMKMIVSTEAEANNSILQQEGKSVLIWYPDSVFNIIGQENLLEYHGMDHKYIKNLILHLVGPENLKGKLLSEIDTTTCNNLRSWAAHATFDVKKAISTMVFDYFMKKLLSYEDSKVVQKLKENYEVLSNGLISFPLNIPGTTYYKSMQARKFILKTIKNIFYERKALSNYNDGQHDYLNYLFEEMERTDTILSESSVIAMILVLLFASNETISSSMTLALKYISDHPRVLDELKKEHEAILKNRTCKDIEITWEEYKSMTFTHMVINETVRLANVVPFIMRKVLEDIEINGYTIPEGWLVMVVPPTVHLNPVNYEDPHAFNPWRWEGKDLHVGSKTFLGFGGGKRLCAGADFVKLQMATFLHHLVTKYRWEVTKEGSIVRQPSLDFSDGFHIKIKARNDDDQ